MHGGRTMKLAYLSGRFPLIPAALSACLIRIRTEAAFPFFRLSLALLERDRFRRFHLCASGPDC